MQFSSRRAVSVQVAVVVVPLEPMVESARVRVVGERVMRHRLEADRHDGAEPIHIHTTALRAEKLRSGWLRVLQRRPRAA